ncbi:hypothetical protein [Ruegeria sp.]|uniref:hypothetical protein n=1 Tax=Ruegeria sp. TaxID=1879320 RepID=UPI003B5C38DC
MNFLLNFAIGLIFSVIASFFVDRPEGVKPQSFDENSVTKEEGADIGYLVGTAWHPVQPHWDGNPRKIEIKSDTGKK